MKNSYSDSQIMRIHGFLVPFIGGRCTATAYMKNVKLPPIRKMMDDACREPDFLFTRTDHVVGPFFEQPSSHSIGIQTSPVRQPSPVSEPHLAPVLESSPQHSPLNLSQQIRRRPVKRMRIEIADDSPTMSVEDYVRLSNPSPVLSPVPGPSVRPAPEVNSFDFGDFTFNCVPLIKREPDSQ